VRIAIHWVFPLLGIVGCKQASGAWDNMRCGEGMLYVAGGSFVMGDDDGARQKRHKVTLSPYCIDRTEVTQGAYRQCVAAGGCTVPRQGPLGCDYDRLEYDDHPINCVTWDQANTYCNWTKKRLPTEAEWEYAALGSDGRRYPWGDSDKEDRTKSVRTGIHPKPVGSKPEGASPFGVLDMAGNVAEWVADWSAPYGADAVVDPKGPAEGESRAHRGSGFGGGFEEPLTMRGAGHPSDRTADCGMRCARSL
jgi:formylglycine-generating enzyme required for sulfatase activity